MNHRSGFFSACFAVSALVAGCGTATLPTVVRNSPTIPAAAPAPPEAERPAGETAPAVPMTVALAGPSPVEQTIPARSRTLREVPTRLAPLDLSRPPSMEELMAAGQLGGQLYPTHSLSDTGRADQVNLSFGTAIQEWNKHNYRQAAELFKQHISQYPDSPWVAEAQLHLGCDAQYTGRYSESEQFFAAILASAKGNVSEGMEKMVNKAILRMGVLKAHQNNFDEAVKLFTDLVARSDNWRDRTYASHWLQRLAVYNGDRLALLNCGTLALAHLLEKNGQREPAMEIGGIVPTSIEGQSMQELQEIAGRFGYSFGGYRMEPAVLASLPLPAIVQVRGKNPGDSGHYWVLEKLQEGRLELFDAQAGRYFSQDLAAFGREWSGNVLVFEGKGSLVAMGEKLSTDELSRTFGGCCGVPRPPSNLGDPPDKPKHPKDPCGSPVWSVNPVNMNLYVQDIPLWYYPAIGPEVKISLSYNAQSSIAWSEPFGRKWQFNYGSYLVVDTGGQVTIFMPDGRHDIYSPDGSGGYLRPSGVFNTLVKLAENRFNLTFPNGTVYEYNIPAGTGSLQPFLVKITDANGHSLTFGYDASIRLTTITDAVGKVTNITYNGTKITSITDPFGRSASFGYTGDTLTGITDMAGYLSTLAYDTDVYLTKVENSRGAWNFYVEPATSASNGSNAFPPPGGGMWANYRVTITDPEGNSEIYMYNGYSNYGWHVSPNFFTPYVDGSNNSFANSDVKKTRYNYITVAGIGRVSQITYPDGSKESYTYDNATGLRDSVTDGHGHKTLYDYNSMGSLTGITTPKGIVTTRTYAVNGVDLTGIVDGAGTLAVTYDTRHRITSRTDRAGNTTGYTYNIFGKVATSTDPLGNVTTYSYYDAAHASKYRLKDVSAAGKIVAAYTYDTIGRVQSHTDATGLTLTYAYDTLDRITTVTWPDGGTETYVYSGCCPRLVDSYTDRAGKTTRFIYDSLQRLIEIGNPDGTGVRYAYDRNGNLARLTDANGNATVFTYDPADRLIARTHADGKVERYTYDNGGLLSERSGGRGIRSSYAYDADHGMTSITYSDGTPSVSFTRDNAGRVVSRTDGAGIFSFTYNATSRLTSLDGPWADDTISFTRDSLGRTTSMQLQGAEGISYTYDALGRLTSLGAGTRQFTYAYPATASPFALTLIRPNGAVTTYATDSLNRLTGSTTKNSSQTVLAANSFPYTAADERTTETVTGGPTLPTLGNGLLTFDYNRVNQLISSTNPSRLYTHDGDGNLTGGYTPAGYQFTASYDAENRLKRFDYTDGAGGAHRIDYHYGGDNFLVRQVIDGVETRFVRFGGLTLQERNSSNTATRSLVWDQRKGGGVSGLLEITQGGNRYYPVYDGKGNVRDLLNSSQAVAASYGYDPFGLIVASSGSVQQPYRYSTKAYDESTGLAYYGYRFYSPVLQRWLTRDPIGVKGGFNLYGFVENNPNRFVDPWGLDPGDPFSSADEAGRDAIQYINDTSIAENKEYGGYVYKNDDGTYSYTKPNPGTLDSTQLGPKPDSGTTVGDYHTHGAYDPKYDNENFSPQDKVGYGGDYRYGYLGTPNKTFQRYDSKTGEIKPCK